MNDMFFGKIRFLISGVLLCILYACGGEDYNPAPDSSRKKKSISEFQIKVQSSRGVLEAALVCLDINTDFKCDANEPSDQSNSKGQAKVKVPNGQKLDGLYIVVHTNADKTKVIASNDSDDNTNEIIERAAYTMIAPVFPTKSKVNVTPISTYISITHKDRSLTIDEASDELAAKIGLPEDQDSDILLGDILSKTESDGDDNKELISYARNIVYSLKRFDVFESRIFENIVDRVARAKQNGIDIENYNIYPVGNAQDGNTLSYRVDKDGNAFQSSLRLECQSQPGNHAGVDIANIDNDPLHKYQWHIHSNLEWIAPDLIEKINDTSNIHADDTYMSGYTGACVKVAVVDSPISIEHPDLIANVIPLGSINTEALARQALGGKFSDAVLFDPRPEKWGANNVAGHGTSVAGIIGATANNNKGSRGVAPGALLRSFSAPFQGGDLESGLPTGNSSGSNSGGSDKDADPNDSIIDKAKQDTKNLGNIIFEPSYRQLSDVDIFNYSGSLYSEFSRYPKTMPVVYREALRKGTSQLRDGLGAVYVASSGNGYLPGDEYCSKYSLATQNGNEVLLPCQIIAHLQGQLSPYTISVGAHNSEGIITYYSTPGSSMWLTAPSNDRLGSRENPVEMFPGILASDIQGCDLGYSNTNSQLKPIHGKAFETGDDKRNQSCDYTSDFGGTSAAAPVVSGAIALILEKHSDLNWRQVKYVLAKSANKLEPNIAPILLDVNGENYEAIPGWVTNAAGFNYQYRYGFGGLNVDGAMLIADDIQSGRDAFGIALSQSQFQETQWVTATIDSSSENIPDNSIEGASSHLTILQSQNLIIEGVQVSLNATGTRLSDLSVELYSPSGTKSILWSARSQAPANTFDPLPKFVTSPSADLTILDRDKRTIFLGDLGEIERPEFSSSSWHSIDGEQSLPGFVLLTNQFYGEDSAGTWTLRIVDTATGEQSYETIEFDDNFMPKFDDNGNPIVKTITVSNPENRILQGWALKIFGHKPVNE